MEHLRMKFPVIPVASGIIIKDNKILIGLRSKKDQGGGLWEFPGGKVEPGETPEQALVRELSEELGIKTWNSCLAPLTFASHAYEKFHLLMPLFVCRKWEGIVLPKEKQELKWVYSRELKNYPMPPADIPLISILRDWI